MKLRYKKNSNDNFVIQKAIKSSEISTISH